MTNKSPWLIGKHTQTWENKARPQGALTPAASDRNILTTEGGGW